MAGSTFIFRVSAINAIGESPFSDSVTIIAAQVPSPPTAPTLVTQDKTQITVAWTASYDGGSPVRHFNVYISDGSGYKLLSPNTVFGDVTTYNINQATHNIITGQLYNIGVSAVNDVGEGVLSSYLQYMAALLPTAP